MSRPEEPEAEPRLRRWGRFRLASRELVAIAFLLVALIAVVTLRESCARGVGNLMKAYEVPDAGTRR